jgi:uncharacterized membrane protein YeaQ/YmgE (transglycosylase-associated protein family)
MTFIVGCKGCTEKFTMELRCSLKGRIRMTLLVLALIACYVALMFKKYRNKFSIFMTIALCIIATTGATLWGLCAADAEGKIIFFYSTIDRKVFMLLMAAWYIFDLFCAVKIIRNYIEYRKLNPRTGA